MNLRFRVLILIVGATLGMSAFAASPQQGVAEGQDPSGQSASTETGPTETDRHPAPPPDLSGPETLSPGTANRERSYFLPSVQIFEWAETNAPLSAGPNRFGTIEALAGGLAAASIGRHSRTVAQYESTVTVYNQQSSLDSTAHQVGLAWAYQGARWNWLVDERANLMPQSAFGFPGFGWQGSLGLSLGGAVGSNLASLNPNFDPDETIFRFQGSRFTDATTMTADYVASARSVVAMTASYSTLTFLKKGNIDSSHKLATLSYSHSLTSRDYFSVSYGFSLFQFQPINDSVKVHFAQFGYGHRVRGKTSIQLGGGPQVSEFHLPFFGTSTKLTWGANGGMQWRSDRNAISLSANRYMSNGGGILVGSITELVSMSWSRQLSRKWRGTIGPSYAHNASLPQSYLFFRQPKVTYESIYAAGSLSRSLGPYANLFLQYQLSHQTSRTAGVTGGHYLDHSVQLGFDWHRRPITVE